MWVWYYSLAFFDAWINALGCGYVRQPRERPTVLRKRTV